MMVRFAHSDALWVHEGPSFAANGAGWALPSLPGLSPRWCGLGGRMRGQALLGTPRPVNLLFSPSASARRRQSLAALASPAKHPRPHASVKQRTRYSDRFGPSASLCQAMRRRLVGSSLGRVVIGAAAVSLSLLSGHSPHSSSRLRARGCIPRVLIAGPGSHPISFGLSPHLPPGPFPFEFPRPLPFFPQIPQMVTGGGGAVQMW